uniref:Uncharacterized protein n=1 Tax=Thermosporothrix sp. COM3 TaxID=2490863 RepID=A0A455SEF0_9CHLR|nr:hypothetical protein KTC_08870 [Thermosporothrix sp. COM3]
MLTFLMTFAVFALFGLIAYHFGVDSRDGLNSPEWERRYAWSLAQH